ncbi:putative receptor-like protein kinase [Hordeum vulgare]|nr:putative receptor-like protein kinase [Hordeum vulgare]
MALSSGILALSISAFGFTYCSWSAGGRYSDSGGHDRDLPVRQGRRADVSAQGRQAGRSPGRVARQRSSRRQHAESRPERGRRRRDGSMSFFIEGVQNERPVRFSSQQLRGFTQGFAHKVGSGGFGVVYMGRFPDGTPMAVKVLNSTLGRRTEEQFMAEVGTIGRTYHINLVRLYCLLLRRRGEGARVRVHGEWLAGPAPVRHASARWPRHRVRQAPRDRRRDGKGRAVPARGVPAPHHPLRHQAGQTCCSGPTWRPSCPTSGSPSCATGRTPTSPSLAPGARPGTRHRSCGCRCRSLQKCDVYSYGMLLFEMLGRRRNLELGMHSCESQEWYPRWVCTGSRPARWTPCLARAMAAGDLDDTEKAARMCKVALWCVQFRPEDRPFMGNVVRMLEGEEQIATPGNPFAHLAAYSADTTMTDGTTTESYGSSAFTRTGLAVLASSAPARLLLHLAVLVSSAASILQCCGFVDGPDLEVKLLAAAAGLQLLASSNLRVVHIPATSIWIEGGRAPCLP